MIELLLSAALSLIPADEVRAAAGDVEHLPREVQRGVRYLTVYNLKPEEREAALQVVNYTLNALSRARAISRATVVSPTLVRFSISQFAPAADEFEAWAAAWEKLAETDPYFHLRTEVAVDGEAHSERSTGGPPVATKVRIVTTDGGWVDLAAAARLRGATHSAGAVLRADYFVANASVPPRYYEFAGIPATENEFVKSLGLDRAVVDRLRANAGANLIISGVTGKPRRVIWSQGPLGGVYATLDVDRVDAQRDPLRRPVSVKTLTRSVSEGEVRAELAFRFDASEWFAVAPNGMWRTALYDAAGKRQNSVPDRVAKDTSDPRGDGIVLPMLSCIRCHREAGLRPFADDQTRLLAGRVELFSDDEKLVQRAAEFYDEPRLQRQMRFDRETYAAAVDRIAKGLQPDELADRLGSVVRNYAYLPITPEQVAREVGLPLEQFREALSATHDPILLTLLEGRSVLRGQWDSSFAEAAVVTAAFLPRRHGDTEVGR